MLQPPVEGLKASGEIRAVAAMSVMLKQVENYHIFKMYVLLLVGSGWLTAAMSVMSTVADTPQHRLRLKQQTVIPPFMSVLSSFLSILN